MRIPLPSVPQQPVQNGRYAAPAVVPQQNATGQQLAGLGQGVEQVGYELSRRADWQQDQLERAQFDEADSLTADAVRDVKMGYRALVGREATGDARKKAEADLDKRLAKIGESLSPSLQEPWRNRANARRAAAVESMMGHETDQTLHFRVGSLKANIEASHVDGLLPELVRKTKELGGVLGWDETQTRMAVLDETTKFHEDRIRILAKSNPEAAARMLSDAREAKEINPARLDELQGVVKTADSDEKALTLFRTIVADPTRQEMPLSEQERIARTILDYERDKAGLSADVYSKTRAQIEYHFNAQHQLRETQRREVLQQAETIFAKEKALTTETLPAPVQEQIGRLGIYGDVYQKEVEVRSRQFAEDGREAKSYDPERDFKKLEALEATIDRVKALVPPEDADEPTKAEFMRKRDVKAASLEALHKALLLQSVDAVGAELPAKAPATKTTKATTGPKKSREEKLRDLSRAIQGSQGR